MKHYFKLSQIRKAFVLVILFCLSAVAYAQEQIIKHTVDRGETLVSIAKVYGTTVDKIIELNPEAAQFIYVGMVLNIPQTTEVPDEMTPNTSNKKSKKEKHEVVTTYVADKETYKAENNDDFERIRIAMDIGFGKPKGSGCWSYRIVLGINYSFTEEIFAGAKIGYNSSNCQNYENGIDVDAEAHMIAIPLEAGYRFMTSNRKWAFIPYAGFDVNIGVKGKTKIKMSGIKESNDMKIGGKVGVAGVIGARFMFTDFGIEVGYHIPMTDKQKMFFGKDAYPEIKLTTEI